MDGVYELIARRATCRAFTDRPIPEEVLDRVLSAGCQSPSSGGFQAISIIQVTDPDKRSQLVRFSRGQRFIATAPVSLVFCIDYHRISRVLEVEPAPFRLDHKLKNLVMGTVDAAVCAQTMVLAAQQEGLGSCYIGNILNMAEEVGRLLQLPKQVFPVFMLTLGWPKTDRRRQPPKYPSGILVHRDQYEDRSAKTLYDAYRKQNRWQKLPPKPEWVEACCTLAGQLHGPEYAERVRRDIENKGYLGPYQYWFGCYYTEEDDFMSNRDYFDYLQKQDLHWLDYDEKENDKL